VSVSASASASTSALAIISIMHENTFVHYSQIDICMVPEAQNLSQSVTRSNIVVKSKTILDVFPTVLQL